MQVLFRLSLILLMIIQSSDVFAAAAVARRRQMQQQMQQAQEQAYAQQVQAAQQQAYIQQVQQYQQQVMAAQIRQQQEQAMAQQMVAQVRAQQQAYINAVKVRRQQVYDAQQAAMIQAKAQAYQKAAIEEAARQKMVLDAAKMAQIKQMAQYEAEKAAMETIQAKREMEALQAAAVGKAVASRDMPFDPHADDIRDIVDITQVWQKLDSNSRPWTLMIDNQAKVATVSEYMERFRKQGVRIQQPPIDYVHMIDDIAIQNPSMLNTPFKDVLQLVAIMQYDFDNGMNKDELAKKSLGEQIYLANKKRLGR